MNILLPVLAAIAGLLMGRLANIAVRRPGESGQIRPHADCPACRRTYSPVQRIPLLGYVVERGTCGKCGERRPIRPAAIEVITAATLTLLYINYGATFRMALVACVLFLFLVIALFDIEQGIIPNKLVYPAIPLALLIFSIFPLGLGTHATTLRSILYSLLAAGVGFTFLLVPALLWSHGMGWGDVKYAGLIGLITGFPGIIAAMALAACAAGVSAIFLVATGTKDRGDSMPFGPFLSAGAIAALVWGPDILGWYLSLPHR